MLRASVSTLLVLFSLTASAQTDGGVTSSPAPAVQDTDSLRRDFEQKLDAARREVDDLRKEMRAQLATQSVAQGWQEDWVDEKRKLELVTFDGYLRMRPDLFWRFDLGSGADQAGYSLWPANPNSATERTNVGVNMRFRFEPTIDVWKKFAFARRSTRSTTSSGARRLTTRTRATAAATGATATSSPSSASRRRRRARASTRSTTRS